MNYRAWQLKNADTAGESALLAVGYGPLLARVLACRGIAQPQAAAALLEEEPPLSDPFLLKDMDKAVARIQQAIENGETIVIFGDYDVDGVSATAILYECLTNLGAQVRCKLPTREGGGYGLNRETLQKLADKGYKLIVTVDNGISAIEEADLAAELGIELVITDHHLPGDEIPDTLVVNPNQRGDTFPSKSLAGVGVIFYVLIAVRSALRAKGAYPNGKQPNLQHLIDLVALGTVADVVPLDRNNRILVSKGLDSIRAGKMQPGVSALLSVAGKNAHRISANDLGYILGPRINAAGRLDSINKGVECLTSYDYNTALFYAKELDQINAERRNREVSMQSDAILSLQTISVDDSNSIVLKGDDWHAGIIGLVASRIKEQTYRPVIAFAPSEENGEHVLKGSGRSIPGIHRCGR